MKKTLILLAALAFTSAGTSFAQTAAPAATQATKMKAKQNKPKKSPQQKADHGAAKMAKELGLNADQEARIEKILLARQQELKPLKEKYGQDRKAGQSEMKAVKDRYKAQIKEVLTAEQYAKYEQLKDDQKGKGRAQGQGKMKMKGKA
jgi:Spy/CpxP family protein refolding chaperone